MSINVLRLDSSLFAGNGQSTLLNDLVEQHLRQVHGELNLVRRDLGQNPLPHLSAEFLQALGTPADQRTTEQAAAVALADTLIAELQAADLVILAAPMYNFAVPSVLKTWMDYVARAGTTFKYTEQGPVGMLADKPVYVQTTRGGLHQGASTDTVVPLLTAFFKLIGVQDLRFTYAEGLNMGALRTENLAKAHAQILAA